MSNLSQIVYLSSATELLDEQQLNGLLASSRRYNRHLGISGMLLYCDGNFMQVIEGERQTLTDLMESIERDLRHSGVLVLLDESIVEREFSEWSMAYRALSATDAPGFSDFFEGVNSTHQQQILAGKAKKLLISFRDHL